MKQSLTQGKIARIAAALAWLLRQERSGELLCWLCLLGMTARPQRDAETCRRPRFHYQRSSWSAPQQFRIPNSEFRVLSLPVKLHKSAYSLLCKCSSIPKVRKAVPFPKKAQNLPSESTSEMSLFPFSFLCILPIDKKARKPL